MAIGSMDRVAVVVGAGPAGLTAAHELLKRGGVHPVIIEADTVVGGLSRTVNVNGNRMDIGGHRFFSKNRDVIRWWLNVLPLQSAPAKDEASLGSDSPVSGCDPELLDNVMLRRRRLSRIFFLRRFFDYPIKVSLSTFRNLGLYRTLKVVCGYLVARVCRREEVTLEDFYINRFGRPLYRLFFEGYTAKVWGKHPSELSAGWGSQRIKGISLYSLLCNAFKARDCSLLQEGVETSLIESFLYPKFGPGQLWEHVADDVVNCGAEMLLGYKVTKINMTDGKVVSVVCEGPEGVERVVCCDYLFSSMPLSGLLTSISGMEVPSAVLDVARNLPYRDFITVGLLLKGLTAHIPDTWVYIQERDFKVGRLQFFNNWSPYMVADSNTVFIGMEYFCNEGDDLWNMSDSALSALAFDELLRIGFAGSDSLLWSNVIRMRKAYPAYHGSYAGIDAVQRFVDGISNLYCIGRNGQHRYNNMDHSMLSAMRAVDALHGVCHKSSLWDVNTDMSYNEERIG